MKQYLIYDYDKNGKQFYLKSYVHKGEGYYDVKWTDDINKAKRYKHLSSASNAIDKIWRDMGMPDATIKVINEKEQDNESNTWNWNA